MRRIKEKIKLKWEEWLDDPPAKANISATFWVSFWVAVLMVNAFINGAGIKLGLDTVYCPYFLSIAAESYIRYVDDRGKFPLQTANLWALFSFLIAILPLVGPIRNWLVLTMGKLENFLIMKFLGTPLPSFEWAPQMGGEGHDPSLSIVFYGFAFVIGFWFRRSIYMNMDGQQDKRR